MYVSAPPPPVLSVAVPAEISMRHGTESQSLKLAQYQIVRASVAEGGMDKVVMNVGRHKFSADTEVPLKTGQELNLQVMATKPRIHLRIMEAAELKHLFRLLNSMGDNVKLAPLLRTLQGLAGAHANNGQALPAGMGRGGLQLPESMTAVLSQLARLFQANPGQVKGEDLAGLWQKLGLNLEALLAAGRDSEAQAGLKSVLFKAAPQLDQQGIFPDGLDKVMEQLNLFQLCRHRLAQESIFFLPLPFAFLEQGYMLAEREGGSGEEGEGEAKEPAWKMTLHLKLSVLGSLEIKLLFEDEALRLRVLCDSKGKAEMISRAMPRLADRLTTVSLKGYSVDAGAEEPVASLVKRLVPDGKHFLEAEV